MTAASLQRRRSQAQRAQSFFREINDRVAELSKHAHVSPPRFICECLCPDCGGTVALSLADYASVRSDPARFIVLAGHEDGETEVVLQRHAGWLVVQKPSEATTAGERGRSTDRGFETWAPS